MASAPKLAKSKVSPIQLLEGTFVVTVICPTIPMALWGSHQYSWLPGSVKSRWNVPFSGTDPEFQAGA